MWGTLPTPYIVSNWQSGGARSILTRSVKIERRQRNNDGWICIVFDHEDFMTEVMKIATEIANGPTVAYKLTRKLYWDSLSNDFETQLSAESAAQSVAGKTEDCYNGIMAFLQKKKPDFQGK